MLRSPVQAYEQVRRSTDSNRQLESAALFRAARQLEECQKEWDHPGLALRLSEALNYNLRLWTFFQGELTAPEQPLSMDLRRDLLALGQFVDKRTFEVINTPAPEKLTALISINRHIASGLAGSPA